MATASVSAQRTAVAEEVFRGLTSKPKTLCPWLFYDAQGSRLFEQITELPEYYVTRTERAIFAGQADAIMAAAVKGANGPLAAIELGAGTASKTGLLLAAMVRLQGRVDYYAIDVSITALEEAKQHLERELPGVWVHARVGDYTEGLGQVETEGCRKLVLYIGSSIGNFEPEDAVALLAGVRRELAPGDRLLLGADQVKDAPLLEAAYDDAAGVTAAFNLNVLSRINRELGANFDLAAFRHRACWDRAKSRVEMHLESTCTQQVKIPALDGLTLEFAARETIHTESSYKFTDAAIARLLERAGFALERTWKDPQGWFGVYLAEARG